MERKQKAKLIDYVDMADNLSWSQVDGGRFSVWGEWSRVSRGTPVQILDLENEGETVLVSALYFGTQRYAWVRRTQLKEVS